MSEEFRKTLGAKKNSSPQSDFEELTTIIHCKLTFKVDNYEWKASIRKTFRRQKQKLNDSPLGFILFFRERYDLPVCCCG